MHFETAPHMLTATASLLVSLALFGCTAEDDGASSEGPTVGEESSGSESSTTDTESSETDAETDTETDAETDSETDAETDTDTDTDSDSSDSSDSGAPPPGCTDNAPDFFPGVIDANTIRLSSMDYTCDETVELEAAEFCDYDDYDARLVIPNLEPGTYDLSEGIASFVIVREWDHDQSAEGCFCVEAFSENIELTQGQVTVAPYDPGYTVTLTGIDHPQFGGEQSFLVPFADCG